VKPLLSTRTGPSEVVATPAAPPDAEVVVLVPAPGVTDLLLLTELVLVVLPHAAASMSVAVAPSRRTVNIEPDMMTSPVGCLGETSQWTIWGNGFRAVLVLCLVID